MKTFQFFAIAAILLGTASSNVHGQLFTAALPATIATPANASSTEAATYSKASILVNKAGYKAVKNFISRFKDGDDVKWVNDGNVILASFDRDDIKTMVVFDTKGNWMRNMKTYAPDKLSKEILDIVKGSRYRNYEIYHVQEFLENNLTFYVIHIENDKTKKQVVVCEGQLQLLSGFDKQ